MDKSNPSCGCGEDAVCNEVALQCDRCCRCIPQRLCARLEAYGCDCDGNSALLPLVEESEYRGILQCGSEAIDLTVKLLFEDEKCYWQVTSDAFYLEERFEISPEKQSCERPELELEVSFYECGGTLRISRHEERRLPTRLVEECDEPFCTTCKCVCRELCVTIVPFNMSSDPYSPQIAYGELRDVSIDELDPPLWKGTIAGDPFDWDIELTLAPSEYDRSCLIGGTINGNELEWVEVTDCANMQLTLALSDGTKLEVVCKKCTVCPENLPQCCSCDDTYAGCIAYTETDPCVLEKNIAWTPTPPPGVTSPNDWGTTGCEFWCPVSLGASRFGCEYAWGETIFRMIQVVAASDFARSVGVEDCEWVMEIYADGVYIDFYLEYSHECLAGEKWRSPLDWIQFFSLPIPGTSAVATITMVRLNSTTDLCIPDGRLPP